MQQLASRKSISDIRERCPTLRVNARWGQWWSLSTHCKLPTCYWSPRDDFCDILDEWKFANLVKSTRCLEFPCRGVVDVRRCECKLLPKIVASLSEERIMQFASEMLGIVDSKVPKMARWKDTQEGRCKCTAARWNHHTTWRPCGEAYPLYHQTQYTHFG